MSKKLIIGICILLILLNGCINNSYAFDFNSTSNANCNLKCEQIMKNHSCFEASPSYRSSFTNNIKKTGVCSCYIRLCLK